MSFAITALHRCATTYLASQLNKSPTWIVAHEPGVFHWTDPRWGVVDSRIMRNSKQLKQKEIKGIVLRHPLDIYFSVVRRWVREPTGIRAKTWASEIHNTVRAMDQMIQTRGLYVFKFHEIITDVQAIVDGAKAMGIDDLDPNTLSTASVNSWVRYDYALDDLDPALVQSVRDGCAEFAEKYALPLECEVVNA